jgi:hypothetical protein
MKVKILSAIETVKGKLVAGNVLEVKPKTAKRWIDEGKAVKTK